LTGLMRRTVGACTWCTQRARVSRRRSRFERACSSRRSARSCPDLAAVGVAQVSESKGAGLIPDARAESMRHAPALPAVARRNRRPVRCGPAIHREPLT
jgi:hypothetical protein